MIPASFTLFLIEKRNQLGPILNSEMLTMGRFGFPTESALIPNRKQSGSRRPFYVADGIVAAEPGVLRGYPRFFKG